MTRIHGWHRRHSGRPAYEHAPISQKNVPKKRRKKNSQECVMSPDAAQLVITDPIVARHPEGIRELALLLNREQDIALHAEHECGGVRERAEARR
ncbi:hypothetical protein EW146_g10474 [Bondarzewia mesenterica]|uniref:Uncharacterized protein n=1 Tax=Bondarzewia mesenterica TaxID=1095465 RepID=A0A4V3XBU0_9AGAM|nr:hypothetical protein EW146_g10474 [Bondarzewia mesenterica]